MSKIDELNFKIILDDKEFNQKIKDDLAKAKEFNTELSKLLQAQRAYNQLTTQTVNNSKRTRKEKEQEAKAWATIVQKIEKAREAREKANAAEARANTEYSKSKKAAIDALTAEEKLSQARERGKRSVENTNKALYRQSSILRELVSIGGMYLSVRGMMNLARSVARVTGEFEMQKVALGNIVKDVKGANRLFERLQGLAIESPMTFQQLLSYTKQLSAFSVPLSQLYDTTKMLADISSGLGVDMGRLTLAYGQVKAATVLRGQEIRQFTEAGVPLLQKLAEQFSILEGRVVTTGEVFDKVSKRLVSFEMVDKVLKDLTSEGGQFFNMQAVLADTVGGKIQKLTDAWQQLQYHIGESNSGIINGVLDTVLSLIRDYKTFNGILGTVIATFGAYQVASLAAAVATGKIASAIARTDTELLRITKIIMKNPYAAAIASIVALAGTLYVLHQRTSELVKMQKQLNETTEKYQTELAGELSGSKKLFDILSNLKSGTEEYEKVRKRILSEYGAYLTEVDKEKLAIGELSGVYERLAANASLSIRERFKSDALESIHNSAKEAREEINEQLTNVFEGVGIKDAGIQLEIRAYMQGIVTTLSEEAKKAYDKINWQTELNASFKRNMLGQLFTSLGDAAKIGTMNVDDLANALLKIDKVEQQAATSVEETSKKMFDGISASANNADATLQQWQRDLNKIVNKSKLSEDVKKDYLQVNPELDLDNYQATLQTKYEQLDDIIYNSSKRYRKEKIEAAKQEKALVKQLIDQLESPLSRIKNPVNYESKEEKEAAKEFSDEQKEQLKNWKDTAATIEKVKRTYESLKEVMPESMAKEALESLFSQVPEEIRKNLDFDSQIAAIAEKIRTLDEEAANQLLNNNSKDEAANLKKNFEEAFKAGEKFYKAMSEWLSKDFNLQGTGAVFDISKIIADLNTANAKVGTEGENLKKQFVDAKGNELAIKALREKYGEEVWNNYLSKGETVIDELMKKEREYNVKVAQNKITALADKYAKENLNIDLSSISKRSIRQVEDLRVRIESILSDITVGDLRLDEEITDKINEAGLSLDDFKKALEKLLNEDIEKLNVREFENVGKALQKASKWASSLGKKMQEIGNAIRNEDLASIGEAMESLANIASRIGEGATTGGGWGALAGGIVGVLEEVANSFVQTQQSIDQTKKSLSDYAHEVERLKFQVSEDSETIWGKDIYRYLSEAFVAATNALDAYNKSLEELNNRYNDISEKWVYSDDLGDYVLVIDDVLDKLQGLQKMQVKVKDRNGFANFFGFKDQYKSLFDYAPDLWNENGELIIDNAEKLLQTSKELSDEQKTELQQVINFYRDYESLQEKLQSSLSELVGSVASDLTDALIDNFLSVGNAVDDLSSCFEDLGDTILKSLLNSFVINDILNEYTPMLESMIKSYSLGETTAEDVASGLAEITDGIQSKLESSSEFINQMIAAFQDKGLLSSGESSSSSSLSEGIKSITEDTASLLASYVNAIRADVSYGKVQREGIATDVKAILGLLPSAPSLAEHLTQIQANTFNSAAAAQSILTELQSVIAPYDGGGYGINVNN